MASSVAPHQSITVFLVANIHCSTCVSSIQEALQELDEVRHVSPNIITSCVAVSHHPCLPIEQMLSKLETAGFEVSGVFSEIDDDSDNPIRDKTPPFNNFDSTEDWFPSSMRLTRPPGAISEKERMRAHLNSCKQCRGATANESPTTQDAASDVSRENSSPGATKSSLLHTDLPSTHPSSVPYNGIGAPRSWTASLAISGMTCAACANTITSELEKEDWITTVAVNLVSNSAVVEYFGGEGDVNRVVETIDDLGYSAQLDQVKATNAGGNESAHQRKVNIYIDGFYCPHCGDCAVSSLASFGRNLQINKRPTLETPILEIAYFPQAPVFTVRQILAAIEASDPAFTASIYHEPTLEERAKKIQAWHQRRILRRALFTFVIAIPTFIIGIVYMGLVSENNAGARYFSKPWVSGINRAQIILFALATPVYFFATDLFHRSAIKEVWLLWRPGSRTPISRRLYRFGSMNLLISLGTSIAYIASIVQMIVTAASKHDMVDTGDSYFDSVVFLTLFLLIGRFLEAYSKSKAGNAIDALGKLRPTTAILVEKDSSQDTGDRIVGTDMLEVGDIVRIPHGASPPCDGVVIEGNAVFNEASLTGESNPVKKNVGDQVFSGTINQDSSILICVTATIGKSMLDQIIKVVREGQAKRAPLERFVDTLVAYFVPVITLVAIITWVVWLIIVISDDQLAIKTPVLFSLQFSIAVFMIACPCGLALAAPTAIFVGSGIAAAHGILVKGGGEAFEMASRTDCVVFDKTGTLTIGGEPSVADYETYLDEEKENSYVLAALRAVEENSSHPIAKAVMNYCKAKTSVTTAVSNVEEIPGKGIKASCNGESFDIVVGNEALMRDYSVDIPPAVAASLRAWKTEAKSVVLVAVKSNSTGDADATYMLSSALSISDPIRPETTAVIKSLRSRGCDVWMLSGDNALTARAVALRVGIPEDNVIAELLPAQKSDKIKYLQTILRPRRGYRFEILSRRATIAMVGDGVNDAPALSTADLGIAIGSGSDVAISSADFVLVNSNLSSVIMLLELSQTVFWRIRFNCGWALVYNLIAVPIAAGCFYAVKVDDRRVVLGPVWAGLAMALSSFSVIMSSLALRTRIPGIGFRPRNVGVGQL
ncbi:heavy metal translocating P-type ATPase [Xylaria intraflava]|nr:heavy metal translocating P-type ATPase [Xylaria intraflava]